MAAASKKKTTKSSSGGKKSSGGRSNSPKSKSGPLGFDSRGWLGGARLDTSGDTPAGPCHSVYVLQKDNKIAKTLAQLGVPDWLCQQGAADGSSDLSFASSEGMVTIALLSCKKAASLRGDVPQSPYGEARDLIGRLIGPVIDSGIKTVHVSFGPVSEEQGSGALIGLELGAYRFRNSRKPALVITGVSKSILQEASHLGVATNLARHLVNMPAADLNPATYSKFVKDSFQFGGTSVEIWDEKRLKKEGCNLHVAVGQAAEETSRLVRIKYRPKGATTKEPIAFVGKGITFDSGGLDIKPAAGMRLMKKDMGGSASVVGLAWWFCNSKQKVAADFYLALAENAVDKKSFRPGDIIKSRRGVTVEIDNTDAEGRLVLADALDVAVTQSGKDKPALVIDLATLTGAMRVALGLGVAGFFSTDQKLGDRLRDVSFERGDAAWQMPLVAEYDQFLASPFADCVNSAGIRFGGAITAAMFLKKFVGDCAWIHIDMMAWSDGRTGGLVTPGGNGQMVQTLARFIDEIV